ncbi:hypothetical protein IQ07DRAFT_50745 [Pyrenochaeta sp. DS3sAY3a]|nr:hypothetical protein IQ07DRAFT_50745 [Pyrenochaeta sp. DS3sAY3a]
MMTSPISFTLASLENPPYSAKSSLLSPPFSAKSTLASSPHSAKSHSESPGLPGDEYRILKRRQDRDRLEAHFSNRGSVNFLHSPGFPRSPTVYQQAGMTQGRRLSISEARSATRRALGENFDFTDKHFDELQRAAKHVPGEVEGEGGEDEEPIPQRYLDEFYERSREDCRNYDGDQDLEDCTSGIAWVLCDPVDRDVSALYSAQRRQSVIPLEPLPTMQPLERNDSAVEEDYRTQLASHNEPELVSRFSFDSDMPKKKRKFFGRRG